MRATVRIALEHDLFAVVEAIIGEGKPIGAELLEGTVFEPFGPLAL